MGRKGIREVVIRLIPHAEQRYNTIGDWEYDAEHEHLRISVSELRDWRMALAVAVHELVEAALCVEHEIPQFVVDSHDRSLLAAGIMDEPGEHPLSPYYNEHLAATVVERLFCWQIGVHWPAYEAELEKLDTPSKPGVEPTQEE